MEYIVPHVIGYENVAWMLDPDGAVAKGSSLVRDFRNGVVMAKALEERLDKADFRSQITLFPWHSRATIQW